MRIVTYNIQYATGRDGCVDINRIADAVDGADIIALQEVERFWPRSGNVDQVAALSERLTGYYHAYGPGVDLAIADAQPNDPRRRQFGNAIFSRYPLVQIRHIMLPKYASIGSALSIQRSALEVTIDCELGPLRVYSVHLTHLSTITRLAQAKYLMAVHENAVKEGFAVTGDLRIIDWQGGVPSRDTAANALILGDFNCSPDSEEYHTFVGPATPYGGVISNPCGFVDPWTYLNKPASSGMTCEDEDESLRIDFALVSTPLHHHIKDSAVDNQATGSDHYPLWLTLT